MNRSLDAARLEELAAQPVPAALAALDEAGLATVASAQQLAHAALAATEAMPERAAQWLQLAAALNQHLGDDADVQGWLAYTQARLYVQARQLTLAETALRSAQTAWQSSGNQVALARSNLGLTQILAMQGRYAAAETANQAAIAQLTPIDDDEAREQLAAAYNNLANLHVYQEQHAAALTAFDQARQLLERLLAEPDQPGARQDALGDKLADVYVNQATALMSLDRIYAAEAALTTAINHYDRRQDRLNRGRARTNLGGLYLRSGRYTAALSLFDAARRDLLGDEWNIADAASVQNADILLLDHANVYLALNLLPEALTTLEQAQTLLRAADQPYELGQALLTLGLLLLRNANLAGAESALLEAEQLFSGLQNAYWLNRTAVALALLALQRADLERAAARLDARLNQSPRLPTQSDPNVGLDWDMNAWTEAQLLRLHLHLAQQEIAPAQVCADAIAAALGVIGDSAEVISLERAPAMPHLFLRLQHARGAIARASGDQILAQRYFRAAISLLEEQRATLPIEEVRTAFLDDKTALYDDLIRSLLEQGGPDAVNDAFAVVEQARARVLLDRLLASEAGADAQASPADADSTLAARRAQLQQRLHWLYNRWLSNPGERQMQSELSEEIRSHEAAIQRMEWQRSSPLAEAQPVDCGALQQTLAADQQALVYYTVGDEVLAFVVGPTQTRLFRHLCHVDELDAALARWRFQLERAEIGERFLARHAKRVRNDWQAALHELHRLVIAPLTDALRASRLLVIPHGALHQLPFHALWDGERMLLERFEWSYAPSASVAVRMAQRRSQWRWRSLAGLALNDAAIPAARQEVEAVAGCFTQSRLYLDEAASLANLELAAAQADILHIATHGRFRPDNPFFSVLKLADGWVDVHTLNRLPLSAALVVLSACESGVGKLRGGDEVIGVARGFLSAGAQTLIASLWNVHDASTAALMQRFYTALTTTAPRPAAALRSAQLCAIQQAQHPFYWASFFVMGG